MKVVEVVWDDAWSALGETTIKRVKKMKPIRTHTIGYLMANNDDGLALATDIYPDQPKSGKVINFIPHCMIVKWWEYE